MITRTQRIGTVSAMVTMLAFASTLIAQGVSLTVIEPPIGDTGTRLVSASRDGQSFGVISLGPIPGQPGHRWTRSAGLVTQSAWFNVETLALSGNGEFALAAEVVPQLWRNDGVIVEMGGRPTGRSFYSDFGTENRSAVGSDGSWAIGSFSAGTNVKPYRWTASTNSWQAIPGAWRQTTLVHDTTPDGQASVGQSFDFGGGFNYLYREGVGVTQIPIYALGMSDDARFLAGSILNGSNVAAAALLTPLGTQILDIPAGFRQAEASDVSNDGSVVVGRALRADNVTSDAFIWTPSSGTRLLRDVLGDAGLAVPSALSFNNISVDRTGTVVSGWYLDPALGFSRAFVATVPSPATFGLSSVVGIYVMSRRDRVLKG